MSVEENGQFHLPIQKNSVNDRLSLSIGVERGQTTRPEGALCFIILPLSVCDLGAFRQSSGAILESETHTVGKCKTLWEDSCLQSHWKGVTLKISPDEPR